MVQAPRRIICLAEPSMPKRTRNPAPVEDGLSRSAPVFAHGASSPTFEGVPARWNVITRDVRPHPQKDGTKRSSVQDRPKHASPLRSPSSVPPSPPRERQLLNVHRVQTWQNICSTFMHTQVVPLSATQAFVVAHIPSSMHYFVMTQLCSIRPPVSAANVFEHTADTYVRAFGANVSDPMLHLFNAHP